MKKRLLASLLALVMVAGLLPTVAFAAGNTLEVGANKTYATIQAAIDAADAGDTISIAAGTYDTFTVSKANLTFVGEVDATTGKNLVTIKTMYEKGNPTLTTWGSNDTGWGGVEMEQSASFQNLDFISYGYAHTSFSWAAAPISVNFSASGTAATSLSVLNCNFKLADTLEGTAKSYAIFMSIPNVTIDSCTFEGFDAGYGSMSDNGAANNITIQNNTFKNVAQPVNVYYGRALDEGAQGITIKDNTISNDNGEASEILIWDYAQTNSSGAAIKATITGNTPGTEIDLTHVNMTVQNDITLDAAAAADTTVYHNVTVDKGDYSSVTVTDSEGNSYTPNQNGIVNLPVSGDMTFKDASGAPITVAASDPVTITYATVGGATTQVEAAVKPATPGASGAALKGVDENGNATDEAPVVPDASTVKAAQIGENKYDTLAEAFAAAAKMTNPVIEILGDVTVAEWQQVWDADGWTINGNDHTITVGTVDGDMNGDYLFYRAGTLNVSDLTVNITTYGNGFDLNDGTLENVTLTGAGASGSRYGVFFGDNGTVTLDGCVISGFGIAVYSQPNDADSEDKTSELVIKDSEVSDGMIISYAESTTLTGNTITNASEITLNGMLDPTNDPEQVTGTIEENTLSNSNLHLSNPDLDNITISQNNITEGSTVQVNELDGYPEVTGTLDVNNNFWGGEAPSEEQIVLPADSTIPVQKDEYLEYPVGEEPEPEEGVQTGPIISILAGDMPFTDVRFNDWFFESVQYVYQAGLMNGTSYTTFDPYAPLTRAMIWTILCRADGNITSGGNPWYAMGRNWAMQNGISDGTNPDGSITREQLITMLFRYADSQGQSTALRADLSSFADAGSVSAYAVDAMAWGVATGLINGRGQNLAPQSGATRAETAAILTRFANAD